MAASAVHCLYLLLLCQYLPKQGSVQTHIIIPMLADDRDYPEDVVV